MTQQPDTWKEIWRRRSPAKSNLIDWENALGQPALDKMLGEIKVMPYAQEIFPSHDKVFRALELTGPREVNVIIIGQDPYPNSKANGLAFSVDNSVDKNVRIPQSLSNIFASVKSDRSKSGGDLTSWAKQGVLLLNRVLTVERGKRNSHHGKGWEAFTQAVVNATIAKREKKLVLMLWGREAQKTKHDELECYKVLSSSHPGPQSYETTLEKTKSGAEAKSSFKDANHFKKANCILANMKMKEIDWQKLT